MKSFFKEYGFAILTSVVVVALVAVCMVLKEPIQARLGEITNTWGNNVVNSLKFTNGETLDGSSGEPSGSGEEEAHEEPIEEGLNVCKDANGKYTAGMFKTAPDYSEIADGYGIIPNTDPWTEDIYHWIVVLLSFEPLE